MRTAAFVQWAPVHSGVVRFRLWGRPLACQFAVPLTQDPDNSGMHSLSPAKQGLDPSGTNRLRDLSRRRLPPCTLNGGAKHPWLPSSASRPGTRSRFSPFSFPRIWCTWCPSVLPRFCEPNFRSRIGRKKAQKTQRKRVERSIRRFRDSPVGNQIRQESRSKPFKKRAPVCTGAL